MPNPSRPQPGEKPIRSDWGRDVADTVVRRYGSAAARDADLAGQSLQWGQVVAIGAAGGPAALLQVWNGARWEAQTRAAGEFYGADGSTYSSPADQWYQLAVTQVTVTKYGSRADSLLLVEASLTGVRCGTPGATALARLGVGITDPLEAARAVITDQATGTLTGSRVVPADAGPQVVTLFWAVTVNAPIEMPGSQHSRSFRVWEVDAALPNMEYHPFTADPHPAEVPVCYPRVIYETDRPSDATLPQPLEDEDGAL